METKYSTWKKEDLLTEIERLRAIVRRYEISETNPTEVKVDEIDREFISDEVLVGAVLGRIEEFVYYVEIHEDGTKTVRYAGPQLEKILGISRQKYITDIASLIEHCHPDDLPGIYETARKLRNEKKPQTFIYRFFHDANKSYVWLEETVYPQVESQRYTANLGIIRNVTERIVAENALRESRQTLERVINSIDEVVYHVDLSLPEGKRITFVGANIERIFGTPKDVFLRNPRAFLDQCHPDDIPGIIKTTEALSKTHQPQSYRYRFRHAKTNEYIWVEEQLFPGFDEKGNYVEIFGVARDITEQKTAEEKLSLANATYKNLIENYPEGIVIISLEGKIQYMNPVALSIAGYHTFEDASGQSVMDFLTEEQQGKSKERIRLAAEGKDVPFQAIIVKRKDGAERQIESKLMRYSYLGQPAILIFLRDIDMERRLEREQLRAQVAEETNRQLQEEIDERIRTERELSATQKYLRLLIDSSLDMICASDNAGKIIEFNKAAQQTFGYSAEELIGKPVSVLYENPERRVEIMKLMESETGRGYFSGEVINRKKSGEIFTAFLSASVLRDEKGKIIGSMGVSRDITDRNKAEKELTLSEEKYRAIYNQAYIGIALVDTDEGKFLEANQRLCDMLGYSKSELLGKTVEELHLPGDLSRLPAGKDFIAHDFERIIDEQHYLHKSGSEVIVNVTVTLVRGDDQRPLYFVYVYEDLTPKRKAEEQIRLQAAKLNAIFESSSHMIWTIDQNSCLTSFNRNQAEWLNRRYNIMPYRGMSMMSGPMVSSPEYNEFWKQKIKSAFEGTPQVFETLFSETSGETTWREIFMNPIFDDAGNVLEVSCIAHDVTDKKQAEEGLRLSLKEKEILLKEVHHRVKNNLQVISSILNLQSSYVRDKKTLEILLESQNRIKSMAFVHESLYQTKDFSSVSFQEYVGNICRNLVHSYSSIESAPDLELDLDPVRLNLDTAIPCGLITNELLSNALKYAFADGRKGEIKVAVKRKSDKIVITIADNGVGLPATIDFRNTESLGLQLVVTLVEQINGKIKLDTKKGTKFTIEIPASPTNA